MIAKQDVLDRAREWQLRPDIVEKDYVLGWLLAAVAQQAESAANWVFKGGTCLKKCYFETYRFSEDLDFTLLPEAAYDAPSLTQTLREIVAVAHDLSGITFPADAVSVVQRRDKLGRDTFQGKIGYRGPLVTPGTPRILFDLTRHEPVLSEPEDRPVFHSYPDELPEGTLVQSYGIEELVAEKTRALLERTRPRDLYDVLFLIESRIEDIDAEEARELFRKKCEVKGLVPPSAEGLLVAVRSSGELRADWEHMLGHQLPVLPPFETQLVRLEPALRWIDASPVTTPALPRFTSATGTLAAPAGATFWGLGVPLEVVRFAGVNRLLVEFNYHGKPRSAEPYSLRRTQTGGLVLYAWEVGSTHIKAFTVAEIRDLRVSTTPFSPRYQVEFSPAGMLSAPAITRATSGGSWRGGPSRRRYVFRCGTCQKLFRHTTNDSALRAHRSPGGSRCSSRRGHLERTD